MAYEEYECKRYLVTDLGLPGGSDGNESAAMWEAQVRRVRRIPWRREWQPTPVFLPEESHGQRSLVGYSPWVAELT